MLPRHTAAGLTIALLALPTTAAARPADLTAGGQTQDSHQVRLPYRNYYGASGLPDERWPDLAKIARAQERYYESYGPATATLKPVSHDKDTPAWPELAFAGVVLLATAGGVVRMRARRAQRVAA